VRLSRAGPGRAEPGHPLDGHRLRSAARLPAADGAAAPLGRAAGVATRRSRPPGGRRGLDVRSPLGCSKSGPALKRGHGTVEVHPRRARPVPPGLNPAPSSRPPRRPPVPRAAARPPAQHVPHLPAHGMALYASVAWIAAQALPSRRNARGSRGPCSLLATVAAVLVWKPVEAQSRHCFVAIVGKVELVEAQS
jgi:hypothetical protein